MLLVTRVLVIMQLTALLRYPRVTALRFPPSIRSAFQFQKGFRSSIVNTNNGRTTVRMFSTAAVDAIVSAIASKGDEIRVLKSNKAGKDAITPLISEERIPEAANRLRHPSARRLGGILRTARPHLHPRDQSRDRA